MVILDIGKDVGATTSVTYSIKTDCDGSLEFNGDGCDWLKIEKGAGKINFTVTKANEGSERKCYITPVVGDWACDNNKFIVRQQAGEPEPFSCYRGTDNGTDYPTGGGKGDSHPILLCGNIGSADGDSIFVSGGLQYSLDNKETWHDFVTNGTTFTPTDWVKLTLGGNGCCGNPFINISATKDNTEETSTHYRTTTFWFRPKVYPTDGKVPECAAQSPCSNSNAGKPLCTEWEYEIRQCQKGYFWCGEHSYNAVPVKCGEECSKVKLSCDCGEPPTPTCTCSITITGKIPSTGYTDFTEIGSYATTCSGEWGNPTRTSGDESLIDGFKFEGDKIKVKARKNTTTQKTTNYKATIGECTANFSVTQEGTTPGCNVHVTLTGLDEGDTVSLQWNTSTPSNVGNGTYENTLDSDTGSITARVSDSQGRYSFSPSEVSLTCDEHSKTITATKITPTCTCQEAEVRVQPTLIKIGSTVGSTAETTYSHNCEVTIDNTASKWVKVIEGTNKLEFEALSETTSTRNGTIYINDANGDHCETISVSQDPPPPAAHTFSFKFKYFDYEEGPMVTGDYNRYTGYDVTDFEVDGQPATMQVEVYYRRSFFSKDNEDCMPTSFQNYTGGTSANSVQSYLEGTKWCGGSLIHVNGFMVYYNGILLKQMQGHDSELDGTYEGEFS